MTLALPHSRSAPTAPRRSSPREREVTLTEFLTCPLHVQKELFEFHNPSFFFKIPSFDGVMA
jgi:hypothetical protein